MPAGYNIDSNRIGNRGVPHGGNPAGVKELEGDMGGTTGQSGRINAPAFESPLIIPRVVTTPSNHSRATQPLDPARAASPEMAKTSLQRGAGAHVRTGPGIEEGLVAWLMDKRAVKPPPQVAAQR
ncbi:MAG TPA: hypothetical protein VJ798_10815 [Rhizomicrobium sp.]|nr:hypothetical protein [Rhizomicrobium sp.]